MKLNRIKCDRCGREHDANDLAGDIGEAIVTVHRVGQHAAIQRKPDLCANCFDHVVAAVTIALEEPPRVEERVTWSSAL